jgi:drug/metabolite transporter (DMT)-like permease
MSWIIAASLMFISSVMMYLLVRLATRINISQPMQNVSMFIIPTIVYLALSNNLHADLSLNAHEWIIMIATAIAFSYFGSRFSMDSIAQAPNPGYSLIISKSYVVMTAIVAVFLFHQPLTIRSTIAILCIVLFSSFIMIDPKVNLQKTKIKQPWLPLAIGAFFCWGMLSLASKYLFTLGVSVLSRLFWVSLIASILFCRDAQKQLLNIATYTKTQLIVLSSIGILSAIFNYFMQVGIQLAPNVGYINAINASSISAVTIGSALFFKDNFSKRKFLGVMGVTIGLILLVIN